MKSYRNYLLGYSLDNKYITKEEYKLLKSDYRMTLLKIDRLGLEGVVSKWKQ